jgi:catechol 2,3-dioxygenase-like lactoylglutathione lyase family enzyme
MLLIDSVRIAVPDLAEATAAYQLLLGTDPVARGDAQRFQLGRGAVELEAGHGGLHALRFTTNDPDAVTLPASFCGLTVHIDPSDTERSHALSAQVLAIDHVVIQTLDPERAVTLWRDGLGLRLALDRVFAERGLRLLFFRSGGITLEYASPHPPAGATDDGKDRFYGLSYRVADLPAQRARLLAAGVDVSESRPGMRPGTTVASVRAGTAGVLTLLLAETAAS